MSSVYSLLKLLFRAAVFHYFCRMITASCPKLTSYGFDIASRYTFETLDVVLYLTKQSADHRITKVLDMVKPWCQTTNKVILSLALYFHGIVLLMQSIPRTLCVSQLRKHLTQARYACGTFRAWQSIGHRIAFRPARSLCVWQLHAKFCISEVHDTSYVHLFTRLDCFTPINEVRLKILKLKVFSNY